MILNALSFIYFLSCEFSKLLLSYCGLYKIPKFLPERIICEVTQHQWLPGTDIHTFEAEVIRPRLGSKIHIGFQEKDISTIPSIIGDFWGYCLGISGEEEEYEYLAGLIIKPEDKWEFIRLTRDMAELYMYGGDDPMPTSIFIEINFKEDPIQTLTYRQQTIASYRLIQMHEKQEALDYLAVN